jgi:hypothetical protein
MSLTFHRYGATVLDVPIAQLRLNLRAILSMPVELVSGAEQAAAALEETSDGAAITHTLIYRSTTGAPEAAEYVATCTLRPIEDAPHTTSLEWTRAYRPATSTPPDQVGPFISAMAAQDRALAARLNLEYGGVEVFYIDYTLGGAAPAAPAGGARFVSARPDRRRIYALAGSELSGVAL